MPTVVKIGSKRRKKDAPAYIVEVIDLYKPKGTPPHAVTRVTMATHDLGVRLYAVSALEDPQLFVPMGERVANH